MLCPKCTALNPEGTVACVSCGTPLPVVSAASPEPAKRTGPGALGVIFIILVIMGVLALVSMFALPSLNTAGKNGNDAAVRSDLAGARTQAELYYDRNQSSYEGFCNSSHVSSLSDDYECNDNATEYAMSGVLSSGVHYCIQSNGNPTEMGGGLSGKTSCAN